MVELDNRILKNSVFIFDSVDKYARDSVAGTVPCSEFLQSRINEKRCGFIVKNFTIKGLKFSFSVDLIFAKD